MPVLRTVTWNKKDLQKPIFANVNGQSTIDRFEVGGWVICTDGDRQPCLVTALVNGERAYAPLLLKEMHTREFFVALKEEINSYGKDTTRKLPKGTKLTFHCKEFIQPFQVTVDEDVSKTNAEGYYVVRAIQKQLVEDSAYDNEPRVITIKALSLDSLACSKGATCNGYVGFHKLGGNTTGQRYIIQRLLVYQFITPNPNPITNPITLTLSIIIVALLSGKLKQLPSLPVHVYVPNIPRNRKDFSPHQHGIKTWENRTLTCVGDWMCYLVAFFTLVGGYISETLTLTKIYPIIT